MRLRRVLLAVLLALATTAVVPVPAAHAGGPTSVLMVNPASQQARAAYVSDSAYTALSAGVGEGQTGAAEPPATITDGVEEVRLTWLIHDVQIWRIDQVYLAPDDGVWVKTVTDFSGDGRMFDRPAHWHRAADAAGLLAALSTAGLLGDSAAAASNPPPTDSAPAAAEAAVAAPAASILRMIAAGLAGLALGAAGALVAVRARKRTPAERQARVSLSG